MNEIEKKVRVARLATQLVVAQIEKEYPNIADEDIEAIAAMLTPQAVKDAEQAINAVEEFLQA
jgi:hypothetical protein